MFALCLAFAPLALGDAPHAPTFATTSASGEPLRGQVTKLQSDWSITLTGEKPGTVAGGDLISLRRAGAKLPAFPAGPHLVFANGDRLAGEVLAIEKERVQFKARLGTGSNADVVQELSIPLPAVAAIWFQAPTHEGMSGIGRQWLSERRRRDIILLNNGDTRTGNIIGFKSIKDPFQFEDSGKKASVELGNVVAVGLNTDLARTFRPKGQYGRLVLTNGDRLALSSASADEQLLTGRTLFGSEVRIPWRQIVSLEIRQGKAVYLSDSKPKAYEFTPFLGEHFDYQMDRSVAGGDLRLAGSTYDKGIGLHSQCRLTFSLGGAYRRFESLVGLNDDLGKRGSVRIQVHVDGNAKLQDQRELTAAAGPRSINVDVTGGKELTLIVEFGNGGPVQDHVDWAETRLVK